MKSKFIYDYGYIYDMVHIDGKFILLTNFYHKVKYKIIITDFNNYKSEIELEDKENFINAYFQHIKEKQVFISSISQEAADFLSNEKFETLLLPKNFNSIIRKKKIDRDLHFLDNKSRSFIPIAVWFSNDEFISLEVKVQWKRFNRNSYKRKDKLKIVIYSKSGNTKDEIPLIYKDFLSNVIYGFDEYKFFENLFVMKIKNRLFITNIQQKKIYTYYLKSEKYKIQDLNNLGELILTYKKNIVVLKLDNCNVQTIIDKNLKGNIKSVRFDYENDFIVIFTRIISIFQRTTFELIKSYDTEKTYGLRVFNIDKNRILLYYSIFWKTGKKFREKMRILNK